MDVFNLQASIGLDISAFESALNAAMEGAKALTSSFETASAGAGAMSRSVGAISAAFGLSNNEVVKGTEYYNALQAQLGDLESESQRASDKVEAIAFALNKSAEATGFDSEETKALAAELKEAEAEASRMQAQTNALRARLEGAAEATEETGNAASGAKSRFQQFREGFAAFTGIDKPFDALKSTLSNVGGTVEKIAHPFRTLIAHMDESAEAAKLNKDRIAVLQASYDAAKSKVDELSDEFQRAVKETGAASDKSKELASKLSEAENEANSAKTELDKYNDEVGETDKESKGASESSHKFKEALGSIAEKAASAAIGIAKVSAAAIGAGAAAVGSLAKDSLNAYANYEQLVGGVQTLFGAQGMSLEEYAKSVGKTTQAASKEFDKLQLAEKTVLENADKAYMTAGLSANAYIETVTSFSASLLQGLNGDTVKAAAEADLAIRDMSDNANKMGTSMESIQNAYQGFAKQNFTMLDNLKLGYGGTKKEMARLLNDANKLDSTILGKGIEVDEKFEDVSFDQMVRAIHLIQDQMGITGTTSKEAAGTIEGSVKSMSAAWENLKTNLATGDDAKVSGLIDTLIASVETASDNIIPRIEIILDGISKAVDKLAPIIADKLPPLVNKILPAIIKAGTQIIQSIVKQLPTLIKSILPPLLNGIKEIIKGIKQVLPDIIQAIREVLPDLISAFIEALPLVLEMGGEILMALVDGIIENIDQIIDAAVEIITMLVDGLVKNLPKIIDAGITLILKLADALVENIDMIIDAAVQIIITLAKSLLTKDNITKIIHAAIDLILALADALTDPDTLITLVHAAFDVVKALVDALVENADEILTAALELIGTLCENLLTLENMEKMWDAGKDLINKLWDGLKQIFKDVLNWFAGFGEEIGYKLADVIEEAKQWGKDLIQNFIDGCKEIWNKWEGFWEGVGETIYDYLHHSTPEKGPLKDDDKWGSDFMMNFINSAESKEKDLVRTVDGIASAVSDAMEIDAPDIPIDKIKDAEETLRNATENAPAIMSVDIDTKSIAAAYEAINAKYKGAMDSVSRISDVDTSKIYDVIDAVKDSAVSFTVDSHSVENIQSALENLKRQNIIDVDKLDAAFSEKHIAEVDVNANIDTLMQSLDNVRSAAESIIDVKFDTSAIYAAIEQIEKTPIELEARINMDAVCEALSEVKQFEPVSIETVPAIANAGAYTESSTGDQQQITNVSFADANIQIVVQGADRNGEDIADEIAERLAFIDNLNNLKAGRVAL